MKYIDIQFKQTGEIIRGYLQSNDDYLFKIGDKFFWLSNFQKYIVVCVGDEDEKVAKRNLY